MTSVLNDNISTDTAQERWYTAPDGQMVPSVTEILGVVSPDLTGWAAGIASKAVYKSGQSEGLYCRSSKTGITQAQAESVGRTAVDQARQTAADVGVEFHSAAWQMVCEAKIPLTGSKAVATALDNFWQWYQDIHPSRIQVLATETAVYGDGYAGTLDGIVRIDGQVGLLELKTTRQLLPSHAMQAAAYRAAWSREARSPRLTFTAVLRVDKAGAGYEMAFVHQRRAFSAFKAAQKLFFALRGRMYENG